MGERRVVLWADERQLPMVNQAARAGDFDIVACGSDDSGDANVFADRLGASSVSDLRSALALDEVDAMWIASPTILTREHVDVVRRINRPVLCAMPWSPDARLESTTNVLRVTPLLRRADVVCASAELLQHDEPWRAIHIAMHAPMDELPLANLLYSALDLVVSHAAGVESICATLAGGQAVPETIAGLTGHLSAHLRLHDGAAATILLSDRTGRSDRRVDLLTTGALMELNDFGSRLYRVGALADEQRVESDQSIGAVIGREIAAIVDGNILHHPPDHARISMLCDTVLLACRTGQTESPRTVERMSEHV